MMLKTILAAILVILNLAAYAAPKNNDDINIESTSDSPQPPLVLNKADAEKWLDDFSAARDKTGDALFLKNFEKRQTHTRILMALRDQAEKLFGDVVSPYGDCTKAVESVNGYWKTEISLITDPSNNQIIKAGGIVTLAWDAGRYYASCRQLIERLK